jgi:hypothetical protein
MHYRCTRIGTLEPVSRTKRGPCFDTCEPLGQGFHLARNHYNRTGAITLGTLEPSSYCIPIPYYRPKLLALES